MDDRVKTRAQLIRELSTSRERIAELMSKNERLMQEIAECQQSQQIFQESENTYRTLFETTGTAMVIIEKDMTVSLINSEMEKLSDYTKRETEGKKSITDFIAEEDVQKMKEFKRMWRDSAHIVPQSYEFKFIDRNGARKDIVLTISLIPGTKRSIASFLDMTDYRRVYNTIEESEKKYRLLAENVSDIIWTVDLDLRYTYISPSVEWILGYRPEDVTGKTVQTVLTPSSFKTSQNILERALALERNDSVTPARSRVLELEHVCREGSPVWMECKMQFLRDRDGIPVGIVGVTRDITERRHTEKTLKNREQELEIKSRYLEEANTALKVLLRHRENDKIELQGTVLSNVRELIIPYIEKIKTCRSMADQGTYIDILETNLHNVISPFLRNMTLNQYNLTPKEIQVATLIKDGRTTKEIAKIANLSVRAIEFHRENIRKKLGLRNKKANLRSSLLSLS